MYYLATQIKKTANEPYAHFTIKWVLLTFGSKGIWLDDDDVSLQP